MSRRISSRVVPSAATENAWVWPRVNTADPCVRGPTPTSIQMSRISSASRPSGRFLSTAMWRRMVVLLELVEGHLGRGPLLLVLVGLGVAGESASASSSTAFVASWRSSLSSTCVASSSLSPNAS